MGRRITIKVDKNKRRLQILKGDEVENEFNIGLGFTPKGKKTSEGDGKTPEGEYFICTRNKESKFTLFLGINYPNLQDAEEAYEASNISLKECKEIEEAENNNERPRWDTKLGGEIGIHGKGGHYDWTGGCIAMDDEDMEILWSKTDYQTKVEIY